MYVEDLFLSIAKRLTRARSDVFGGLLNDEWHRNFIMSVGKHIELENQLSTNQCKIILKLIANTRRYIVAYGMATDDDVSQMLAQPQHRRPLYQSAEVRREVRHLGNNFLGFRYKQNSVIADQIKQFGMPERTQWMQADYQSNRINLVERPYFDWSSRIWVVPVFRHNLNAILDLIQSYRFRMDDATFDYLSLARRSRDKPTLVALTDDNIMVSNVCENPLLAGWITEVAEGVAI